MGKLPGAVQNERGFERREPVCVFPRFAYLWYIGGFVELEPSADQTVEDCRSDAELVDEAQLDGSDPRYPALLINALEESVVEEEDKLDVRELVPFALGKGAVHYRRYE